MHEHLPDIHENVECIDVIHGGLYESAYHQVKRFYRVMSKRRNKAMEENF